MNKRNLVLIGMPGAGKSTIGVVLAKTMKMSFIDTDLIIQQRENRRLQDIINGDGLDKFFKIEEDVILKIKQENYVIATGGSVVYSNAAMEHLKRGSILIYLKLPYRQIQRRIMNITTRGIALAERQSLHDLYRERVPLYEKYADITIDCYSRDIEEIISLIKSSTGL